MAPWLLKEEGNEINDYIYNDPNIDLNKLAAVYGVYYSIVQRRKKNLIDRILLGYDPRIPTSRATLITPDIRQYVEDLINRFNTLYLDEIVDYVYMEFDVILSILIVCRLLKGARISYKKNQSIVGQRNKELMTVWSFKQRQWDAR
jgi:transposase